MTARVGLTGIEVAVTEPKRPKVGLLGAEIILSNAQGLNVGFTATHVLVKLNPDPVANITSVGTEVMVKFGTPTAYITNQNVNVIISGTPDANLPWMGMEFLVSTTPAVQSNLSWMGMEILMPALPKISLDWVGLEVLVDKRLLDDVPDYMNFGDVYDAFPGQIRISYPQTVSGLTDSTIITLYTYTDGLQFSKDGTTFTNTLAIKNDDQVYLRKTMDNIFSTTYLVYTDSSFTGETETGIWNIIGPSQAVKYDEYLYRETEEGQWVEYKNTEFGEDAQEAEFVDQSQIALTDSADGIFNNKTVYESAAPLGGFNNQSSSIKDSNAPHSEFTDQTSSIKDSDAPVAEFKDQTTAIKYAFAPMSIFVDQTKQIKFTDAPSALFTSRITYFETRQSLEFMFFGNILNRLIVNSPYGFNVEPYIYGPEHDTVYDKFNFNYVETTPLDAIEGKIATPLNWRVITMNYILNHLEEEKLIDVNFVNWQDEEIKDKAQNPEYWIGWKNREILTQWVFENYNLKYYMDTNWADYSVKNFITHDTTWLYEYLVHAVDFDLNVEYKPYIPSNYLVVDLNPYFINLAHNIAYELAPKFVNNPNPHFVNIMYSYEYAIGTLATIDLNAVYENERLYNSTDYVRQGGYPTFELAEEAASSYPTDITIIYQQPEGTYSYNVLYTNSVWCGDVPVKPVLKAIAWYLGGG